MAFRFTYDTYQDVRNNLFLYSLPFLIIAGFFSFACVLPPEHQKAITGALAYIQSVEPWKSVVSAGIGMVVFSILAFLLTEIFQVHDQWYDKFIVKWRFRYATDYILPRLIQPFSSRINHRFYETAEEHVKEFQKRLYYPFVGDRDTKIPKNTLVRFYEVVTVYWVTQINEISLLLVMAGIVWYRAKGPGDLSYRSTLLNDVLIVFLCFLLNRLWIRSSREKVRRATDEEIRAIHDDPKLLQDLEQRIEKLCSDYSIPYAKTPQGEDST
jgi:hypothetical protein